MSLSHWAFRGRLRAFNRILLYSLFYVLLSQKILILNILMLSYELLLLGPMLYYLFHIILLFIPLIFSLKHNKTIVYQSLKIILIILHVELKNILLLQLRLILNFYSFLLKECTFLFRLRPRLYELQKY